MLPISLLDISEQVRNCELCGLCKQRTKAVPGAGSDRAEVMFIGEGPGYNEDQQGLPFVGAAGKFLDELLEVLQLERKQVFITNVVKCRPPGNRDPMPEEVKACSSYLNQQINTINPAFIVTLGRFSMAKFIPDVKISAVHGQARRIDSRIIFPLHHPAAALHQPALRETVIADVVKLGELLRGEVAGISLQQPKPDKTTQMNLF